MKHTESRVNASGPVSAALAVIGMAPAKEELRDKRPFSGPSGRILDDALLFAKMPRQRVFVTNLCDFYIDDNDLYSVPETILTQQRQRVFDELEKVRPNVLLVLGGQTLTLLMEGYVGSANSTRARRAAAKWGITKWRGSIISLTLPSGRVQKIVVGMHPASFVRGQWKWLPLFKYIDVLRAVTQSSFPEVKLTPRTALVGPSFRTAREFLLEMNQQEWVSIDYEGRKHITCLGIGSTPNLALCIPLSRVGSPSYWSVAEECEIWKLWCMVLQNPKVKKIAQNAAYEWLKSWMYGIFPNPIGIDTMLAHHCLYPDWGGITDEWTKRKRDIDNPGHGLALITSQYTDQPYYKDDGRHWLPEYGEDKFWEYNARDVMVTLEAGMKMREELARAGLWNTYIENYNMKFEAALRMEWYGVQIDVEKREEVRIETMQQMKEVGEALATIVGKRVVAKAERKGKPDPKVLNLGSPKQLMAFLIGRGYKPRMKFDKKLGKSKPTFDRDTLQMLYAKHEDPLLKHILEFRKLQDFTNDILDMTLDENGKVHCHFKIGGTNGTRWSSTESILGTGTNLQNIPRVGPARGLFLPT